MELTMTQPQSFQFFPILLVKATVACLISKVGAGEGGRLIGKQQSSGRAQWIASISLTFYLFVLATGFPLLAVFYIIAVTRWICLEPVSIILNTQWLEVSYFLSCLFIEHYQTVTREWVKEFVMCLDVLPENSYSRTQILNYVKKGLSARKITRAFPY